MMNDYKVIVDGLIYPQSAMTEDEAIDQVLQTIDVVQAYGFYSLVVIKR